MAAQGNPFAANASPKGAAIMVETIQPITEPASDKLAEEFAYHASAWEDAFFLTMQEMFAD